MIFFYHIFKSDFQFGTDLAFKHNCKEAITKRDKRLKKSILNIMICYILSQYLCCSS